MTWESVEGAWEEFKSKVRAKWSKLRDGDLSSAASCKADLIGMLRQRYGMRKEEAERELENFIRSL